MTQPAKSVWAEFVAKFDTSSLKRGEKRVGSVTKSLKKLGGVLAATFTAKYIADMTVEIVTQAAALDAQAKKWNTSVEAVQEFQHIMKSLQIDTEAATQATAELQKRIGENNGGLEDALKPLGLRLADIPKDAIAATKYILELGRSLSPSARENLFDKAFGGDGRKVATYAVTTAAAIDKIRDSFEAPIDSAFAKTSTENLRTLEKFDAKLDAIKVRFIKSFGGEELEKFEDNLMLVVGAIGWAVDKIASQVRLVLKLVEALGKAATGVKGFFGFGGEDGADAKGSGDPNRVGFVDAITGNPLDKLEYLGDFWSGVGSSIKDKISSVAAPGLSPADRRAVTTTNVTSGDTVFNYNITGITAEQLDRRARQDQFRNNRALVGRR